MSNTEALRAAAQQALDAMEKYPVTVNHWKAVLLPAADALRAALAQPAAPVAPAKPASEPVAWFCQWFNADGSPEWDQYHDQTDPMPAADEWEDRPPDCVTPLYARPQPAPALVPLTDALRIADGYTAMPYGDGYIVHHDSGGAWPANLGMVAAIREIARLRAADDAHRAAFAAIYTALQPADPDRATWPAEIARLRAMLATVIVGNRTS